MSLGKAATRWRKRACGRGLCTALWQPQIWRGVEGNRGPSPPCNIMMMHFDTKHTIIVHQGDLKQKTRTPVKHIYFFICWRDNVLLPTWIRFSYNSNCGFWIELNENYVNCIYSSESRAVCLFKKGFNLVKALLLKELSHIHQSKKHEKNSPSTHCLPQCLLICFLGLFET